MSQQQRLRGDGFDCPVYDNLEEAIAVYSDACAEIKRLNAVKDMQESEIRALMQEHKVEMYPTPIGAFCIETVEVEKLKFDPRIKRPA